MLSSAQRLGVRTGRSLHSGNATHNLNTFTAHGGGRSTVDIDSYLQYDNSICILYSNPGPRAFPNPISTFAVPEYILLLPAWSRVLFFT